MADAQYSKPLRKWIGVDFDGTLAEDWDGRKDFVDAFYILGAPIPHMVKRVKVMLEQGFEIRIFTSRVAPDGVRDVEKVRDLIEHWCEAHLGRRLEVTCIKDHGLIKFYDDKAIAIEYNAGTIHVFPKEPITGFYDK